MYWFEFSNLPPLEVTLLKMPEEPSMRQASPVPQQPYPCRFGSESFPMRSKPRKANIVVGLLGFEPSLLLRLQLHLIDGGLPSSLKSHLTHPITLLRL